MNDADFDTIAEQYRPKGLCITGCGHRATEPWFLYKGPIRVEFRCHCCVVLARLERARSYAARIEKLEAEHQAAQLTCGKDGCA